MSAFDPARCHIRYNEGALVLFLDLTNEFPERPRRGEFDHALQIVCDPDAKLVRACVALFDGIRAPACSLRASTCRRLRRLLSLT